MSYQWTNTRTILFSNGSIKSWGLSLLIQLKWKSWPVIFNLVKTRREKPLNLYNKRRKLIRLVRPIPWTQEIILSLTFQIYTKDRAYTEACSRNLWTYMISQRLLSRGGIMLRILSLLMLAPWPKVKLITWNLRKTNTKSMPLELVNFVILSIRRGSKVDTKTQ